MPAPVPRGVAPLPRDARSKKVSRFSLEPPGCINAPLSTQMLIERLCKEGWCPHRVFNSCNKLSHATLCYLSSLNRQILVHHCPQECTVEKCVGVTEAPASSHSTNNCHYSIVQPDMNLVKSLIKAGEIPLMQLKTSSSGDLEAEVVKCAPYSHYTAISHVVSTKYD